MMSTTLDFIEYVCEQIPQIGELRYRKMFGEYMIYINDKPLLIVCDNIVYVKKHEVVEHLMKNALTGCPYQGAKEHYILDIDNHELTYQVLYELEKVIPVPKKRARKKVSL